MKRQLFEAFCAAVALVCAAVQAAPRAAFLELSPGDTGGFTLVESPTPAAVAALQAAGKRPLVVSDDFGDEAAALTNWAVNAAAVAFAQLPRRHLLHTWKLLDVKTLKTVRFDPEGSATRFRREASFLAFTGGADGIWLPDADRLPPGWREALVEAREDWRVLLYLESLADEALEAALREPGASPAERYAASLRLVDAYLAGGFPDEAVAFTMKRLGDLGPTPQEKSALHVKMAYAYIQKKDWDRAAQMFRVARVHAPVTARGDLQTEGYVAERRKDWATAVACYGEEAKTYGKSEEKQKEACVRRLRAAMSKLNAREKKEDITSIDELGDGVMSLDE